MRIKLIAINQRVLERGDDRVLKQCLDYCLHRLKKHKNIGLHKAKVKLSIVQRLRNELN